MIDGSIESKVPIGYFQPADLLVIRGYLAMDEDLNEAIEFYKQALTMLSETTYEDNSSIEEEYNEIKIVQIKCNIMFCMFELGVRRLY